MFRIGLGRRSNSRIHRNRFGQRLQHEVLEGRKVLASLTVTNLNDYAPGDPPIAGSLRQAIEIAEQLPGEDRIRFHPSLHGDLALESQLELLDGNDVEIVGNRRVTLSGGGAHRVMYVEDAAVEISRLTIADGLATDAPNVPAPFDPMDPLNAPPTAADFAIGGGLFNNGGEVTLRRVTFENNQATANTIALGGAIANMFGGELTVDNSRFEGNSSIGIGLAAGGAIETDALATTHISRSQFLNNTAAALIGGGNPTAFQGAAVGGAVKASGASELHIERSFFRGNVVAAGNGDFLPGPLPNGSGQSGGFGAGGGAVGSQALSLFLGVIPGQNTVTTVDRTTIVENVAQGGRGADGTAAHPDGFSGGAAGGAGLVNWGASELTVSRSMIVNNMAIGGAGGDGAVGLAPVANGGDGGHVNGAAIEIGFSSFGTPVLNVSRTVIAGNQALGGAGGLAGDGGVAGNGGAARGGAIANSADYLVELLTGGTVSLAGGEVHVRRSIVKDNHAVGGSGNVGGDALGGGIYTLGAAEVDRTIIAMNSAVCGSGNSDDGEGLGGGLFAGPLAEIDLDFVSELLLKHNHASTDGDDAYYA